MNDDYQDGKRLFTPGLHVHVGAVHYTYHHYSMSIKEEVSLCLRNKNGMRFFRPAQVVICRDQQKEAK